MKNHQQRVPIISPLDKDYRARSLSSDELNFSNKALSSYRDLEKRSDVSSGGMTLRFTIVGEREIQ